MRYAKIILLHLEHVFNYRARSFVWFLISLINPLLLLLFWRGASLVNKTVPGWNTSSITTYYLLLAIANVTLISHIEEDISREDVGKGVLSIYILKPFSYFWKKFIEEFPFRILQGSYGLIIILFFTFIFGNFVLVPSTLILITAFFMSVLSLFLSFTFKMILGICSIWIVEIEGIFQLTEIISLIFAGYVVPLYLLPDNLQKIAYILPFSYFIYIPIAAYQGKFNIIQCIFFILIQIAWLVGFITIFKFLWVKGIKDFTDVSK